MITISQAKGLGGVLLLAVASLSTPARAAVTNSAGWTDAFEAYAVGTQLSATNGWSSEQARAGVVTNAPASAFPLLSPQIAAVRDVLNNDVRTASGGVVVVEVQVMPTWSDITPPGDTNQQYALCVKTNQHLAVWQHALTPLVTNTWLELAASPAINTGVWTRLTVTLNYNKNLFQVQVNGASPVTDPAGYAADGVTANGPWFHMVQTNGVMARLVLGDGGTNFVDDVVVTNRSLSWSTTGFTESVTNNGAIDNTHPITVTLNYGTFSGADEDDLSSYVQMESGLPAGLSLVARRASETTVQLTLANAAPAHMASNSVSNLALHFTDGAFSLGQATDVTGYRNSGFSVTFHDTAVLDYSTNLFREATAANDGSINNSLPLTITLTNDLFTGAIDENYATNAAKLQITGMPVGLTGRVVKVDDTHVQMTLLGKALSNASADSISFTMTFQGAAFASNTVLGTVVNGAAVVLVQYVDAPVLTYGTNAFVEMVANDGSVTGTTISLQYDTFTGSNGDDLVVAGVVSAPSLPTGLGLQAIRTSPSAVSLVFSNRAGAHAATDSLLGNVTIAFGNGAFDGGDAARVAGAARSDLSIVFNDPPVLAMPGGLEFTEVSQNNGAIGNTLAITLAGDTFAPDLTGLYTVNNVPGGLTAHLTRDSDTQVTLALTGSASPHTVTQSTSALQVVFAESAFATVAAANIPGSTTNFTVTFTSAPTLLYNGTTFNELSFGTMNNLVPMTITLGGDTFAAAPGGDFSA